MSPELCSLYGTRFWKELDGRSQRLLSLWELVNFFSLTLHGERPLVQGLSDQLYAKQGASETRYLHHFLDEENKHMVMFGEFCLRYGGRVFPDKKIAFPKKYARGEAYLAFLIKALAVEELGDVYNVAMMKDDRLHPIVRTLNRLHHRDESRHIVFGRALLVDAFRRCVSEWDDETLAGFRVWVARYLASCWGDFYNPEVYRLVGAKKGVEVRKQLLCDAGAMMRRRAVSGRLVGFLLENEVILTEPEVL